MTNTAPQFYEQTTVASRLKSDTRLHHKELDDLPTIAALRANSFDLENYIFALLCFRNVYQKLEHKLQDAEMLLNIDIHHAYQPRLPSLSINLPTLSVNAPFNLLSDEQKNRLDNASVLSEKRLNVSFDKGQFPILSKPLTLSAYWGIRYVLDGSCHGAQFLLPRFKTCLGENNTQLLAYWEHLAGLSYQWPSTIQSLEFANASLSDYEQVEHAAAETFFCFITSIKSRD